MIKSTIANRCACYQASYTICDRFKQVTNRLSKAKLNFTSFDATWIAETKCPIEEEDFGEGDIAFLWSNDLIQNSNRVNVIGRYFDEFEFKIKLHQYGAGIDILIVGSQFYSSLTDDALAALLMHDWMLKNDSHLAEIDKLPEYLERAGFLPIGWLQLLQHFTIEAGPRYRDNWDHRCDCIDRYFDHRPKRTAPLIPANLAGCWLATYFKSEPEL